MLLARSIWNSSKKIERAALKCEPTTDNGEKPISKWDESGANPAPNCGIYPALYAVCIAIQIVSLMPIFSL
jgi:hypothetical protein